MKTLPFVKLSPGGNPTVLIRDACLSPEERTAAARELMDSLHLGAEQVGYADTVSDPPRLDMMGGEFCINATRALAVLLARAGRLAAGPDGLLLGRAVVSGAAHPLELRVRPGVHAAVFEAGALLEHPCPPATEPVAPHIMMVRVPGITHLVLDASRVPLSDNPENTAATLRARFGLEEETAVGCIWAHPGSGHMFPVVWVRKTGSTCLETACGSGTLAAALAGFLPCRDGRFCGVQPSGETLAATFAPCPAEPAQSGPGTWRAWIDGPVRVTAQGEAYVACL